VVNLLIYLADQLLRGCQSVDNQVQALQNQATAGFSVCGSRLPALEAEVVQIQLLRISLRYLISVDQQDLVLGGFMFPSF
jgi:spore maturation protein SpmB